MKQELVDLCFRAYSLAVRLRQSRSRYEIVAIETGRRISSEDEDDFHILASELVDEDGEDQMVRYTLFGALTKYSFGYGQRIILEKEQVVI